MALVSERLYLIDDNMMDFYFAPPPGIEWRYSKLKHLLPKSKPVRVLCCAHTLPRTVPHNIVDVISARHGLCCHAACSSR